MKYFPLIKEKVFNKRNEFKNNMHFIFIGQRKEPSKFAWSLGFHSIHSKQASSGKADLNML